MNSLQKEKSPYLLQHASNPVDWYPWSEEAFEKAKNEDRPVFLSIGYSTCHWCHVMEKESFEDEEIASLLKKHFISIKVDREERPDIDSIYMTVCQAMTGRGGWPLSIFMTPDKEPFLATTYIPKENRFGVVGMKELIPRIAEVWNSRRDDIINEAGRIRYALKGLTETTPGDMPGESAIRHTFDQLKKSYDQTFGGFSTRPKFPAPHNHMFLLRYWKMHKSDEALDMVTNTLQHMRIGGIFDHIGGGFHRYSTDERWHLPHFEKMLYDQAMLMFAYTEAFQVTRNRIFEGTVAETVRFLERDMLSREGGFFSAWDADSEGEEGKFYLWERDEIMDILGKNDGKRFCEVFNIREEGNFHDETTGEFTGKNVLHLSKEPEILAVDLGVSPEALTAFLDHTKKVLFARRNERVHPHIDDKLLTDWNGLVIAALAKAHKVFGRNDYLQMAEGAYRFIQEYLVDTNGRLLHRWRDGEGSIRGFLDDYAFLVFGLLELYEASFNAKYLRDAVRFSDDMIKLFSCDRGGFYFTQVGAETVLVRNKDVYDGAYPSGNSFAALALLKLSRFTGNVNYEKEAEDLFRAFSVQLSDAPIGHTFLMSALGFAHGRSSEIVVTGAKHTDETARMIAGIREIFSPHSVFLFRPTDDPSDISELVPFLNGLEPVNDKTTAFVCKDFTCSMPSTDIHEVIKLL